MKITITIKEEMTPEFGCIIPFDLKSTDDELTISCFEELRDLAERFAERYSDDPFSTDALNLLYDEVGRYGRDRDYHYDCLPEDLLYVHYVATDEEQIDRALILPSTRRLSRKALHDMKDNLTEFELHETFETELPGYVTMVDRVVVSAACDNFGGEYAEAALETAPGYRRNGYAASNAAALALEVLRDGRPLSYICGAENRASIALAEKVGFVRSGMAFFCVMYEEEE